MIATAIKTSRISAGSHTIVELLDEALPEDVKPGSILAITSKVVSLCENAVVPVDGTNKRELINREAQYYLAEADGVYGIDFTIAQNTLIPNSGIDESNVGDAYCLWPRDPQGTANAIRRHLVERFGHSDVGVLITDSTCRPLRRGVSGIYLAYSGFKPLKNYVGKPDLFGRPFRVSQADIAGSLATTAVMLMGEGSESTPIAIMSDLPFVEFVDRDPTAKELAETQIDPEEDLFYPFLRHAKWLPGGQSTV